MKLHYLRYFSVLAEELHFGRAAQRLAITQPPLSGAIKALEEELGVRLLLRDSKHVQLTAAGTAFLEEVTLILERVARASTMAKAVAGGLRGRLDIGVTGSLIYREVPGIVDRFGAAMPAVEVLLREMATAQQVDGLLHGQLDAGFINASAVPPQLACLPLSDDVFVCCLPAAHPLAGVDAIELSQLAAERFVMFSRDVAPANHDNVIAIFSRAGIHPTTVHAARQWLTIIAMVAHGMGVSLVPRSLARSCVKGVRFVSLGGEPAISRALLVWNPEHGSPALDSFIACARTALQDGSATPDPG
jgi:DNA-binding transcriptional LysR family regulator